MNLKASNYGPLTRIVFFVFDFTIKAICLSFWSFMSLAPIWSWGVLEMLMMNSKFFVLLVMRAIFIFGFS